MATGDHKRPLRGKFADILYGSDAAWADHYPAKFRARRALMAEAVNLGWSYQECHLEFLNEFNPGSVLWTHGSDDRLLGKAETTKRIMRDYHAATAFVVSNPVALNAAEARQRLGEIIAQANSIRWVGRTGRTDYDVLMAVLHRGTEVGTTRVSMSVRDVGAAAGVTHKTAARALRRLADRGWLVTTHGKQVGFASKHQCVMPEVVRRDTLAAVPGTQDQVCPNGPPVIASASQVCLDGPLPSDHPGHEVWLRLRKSARALWLSLSDAPQPARALARAAGCGHQTALRQLPVLASYALAHRTPDGWVRGDRTPDQVVTDMGWVATNSVTDQRALMDDYARAEFAKKHAGTPQAKYLAPADEAGDAA